MPPLPVLSDPEAFFTIITGRTGTTIEEKDCKDPEEASRKSQPRITQPETTATSSTDTDTLALPHRITDPDTTATSTDTNTLALPAPGSPALSAPDSPSDSPSDLAAPPTPASEQYHLSRPMHKRNN